MANYSVITGKCIKDLACVEACQSDAIHPTADEPGFAEATQLYVNPKKCNECGACIVVCECEAIFMLDELPDEVKHFAAANAAYYKK
jgi:ferredoxin--NADP+ reductase